MTSHLPLTLGVTYTTASGPVTITSIGKSGKYAYSDNCGWWHVETGEHRRDPALDITGRVEPASGQTVTIKWDPDPLMSKADEKAGPKAPLECWMIKRDGGNLFRSERSYNADAVRMIEAAPIEAELARVKAALEHWRQEVGKLHSQVDRLKHDRDAGAKDYCDLMGRYDALQVELARVTADLALMAEHRDRVTAERDEAVAASQALGVENARLAVLAEALRAIADLTEVSGAEFKRRHPALNSELDKHIQEHWADVLSEFAARAFLAMIGGKP